MLVLFGPTSLGGETAFVVFKRCQQALELDFDGLTSLDCPGSRLWLNQTSGLPPQFRLAWCRRKTQWLEAFHEVRLPF